MEATQARDEQQMHGADCLRLRGIPSAAVAESSVNEYSRTVERVYIDFTRKVLTLQKDLRLPSLVRQGAEAKVEPPVTIPGSRTAVSESTTAACSRGTTILNRRGPSTQHSTHSHR